MSLELLIIYMDGVLGEARAGDVSGAVQYIHGRGVR